MAYSIHKDIGGGWYVAENGQPVAFYATKAQCERGIAIFQRLGRNTSGVILPAL